MKITIGASRSDKIGSKLIQWWMGTPYSHVYVRWFLSDQNREIVYHAAHGMVHFKSYDNFKNENEIEKEFEIELNCEQFAKFSSKCIDLAGEPYSKLELLQIFLMDITYDKVHFKDQPGYICSELMSELLEDLGYSFDKPSYLLDPKDVVTVLENQRS